MPLESKEKKNKIVCDVKNCVYHTGECSCKAEVVSVGPVYAGSSTDTLCATFKPKTL